MDKASGYCQHGYHRIIPWSLQEPKIRSSSKNPIPNGINQSILPPLRARHRHTFQRMLQWHQSLRPHLISYANKGKDVSQIPIPTKGVSFSLPAHLFHHQTMLPR